MAIYHTLTRTVKENPGTGSIISDAIMDPETLGKGVKMFAQVTLKPGCAVSIHQHVGNNETYYLIQGSGEYTDEDKKVTVKAGDVTFCPDGGTHGLLNTGKDDLVFIALIAHTIA
ncbi:MAG: cupin domain-containing protein [Acidaminococcus sp.]|uniref:Cupin domain-containing protein n=1 Tax=Acidaminococcus intestini TaxID=187327 RepID=A0A943EF92_9FIRM|nr:cupin domain-containing protein [Acidaminococcus sp.]MBS5519985.1 cupin domain-containing protein [Acidaminococcus intestini]MDY2739610.1 cupin domain-containing protein [Acidaminococcus sp.]